MTTTTNDYEGYALGSEKLINRLVEENMGWATSIAKSVARAWNMDWQLDGLDGGAYEALLFCARRYDPARGVPFRGYARRRIHEACTEEARKSKTWQLGTGTNSQAERDAREISAKLFDIFPELRDGYLPAGDEDSDGESSTRSSIRQMLAGASLVAAFQESAVDNPELAIQYKQLLIHLAQLEPVHQEIVWAVYYKGQSMRALAEEWGTDDLSVIREHKEILANLCTRLEAPRSKIVKKLKIRRGLRTIAQQLRRKKEEGPFTKFIASTAALLLLALGAFSLQCLKILSALAGLLS